MLRKVLFALFFCALLSIQANATTLQAVDLAERQGMLSQRILKIHCQIALNISPDLSKRQLLESVGMFEENLDQLKHLASGSKASSALSELKSAWRVMQSGMEAEPSATATMLLNQQADAVTDAAEQLVYQFQDQSDSVISRWVNTASRQRTLSQRIAKGYMLRQLGYDSARTRQELESTSNEFYGALISMRKRPGNSPVVQGAIADLETQWEWLHSALSVEGARDYRLVVAAGSDLILEFIDKVSTQYALGE